MVAFVLLAVLGGTLVVVLAGWIAKQRDGKDSIYDTGWGWLLPGGWFYKLGRTDDSPRERLWPYLFGGLFDGWLYNAGRERRRRELDRE